MENGTSSGHLPKAGKENKRHGDQQENRAEQMEDSPVDGGRVPCSDNENDCSCALGAVKSSPSSLHSRARV